MMFNPNAQVLTAIDLRPYQKPRLLQIAGAWKEKELKLQLARAVASGSWNETGRPLSGACISQSQNYLQL